MSTWLDLTYREAVIFVALAALGAGPAAFLRGTQVGTRVALAPALGLAVGATALVSAGNVMSMRTAAWVVLLPIIVISLALSTAVARHRHRSGERNPFIVPAVKIGVLSVVVISALNYPLAYRESLGPMAYVVADANEYIPLSDRLESHKIPTTVEGPPWDLTSSVSNSGSPSGVPALTASVNSLSGWRSSDSQSSWMIVLVLLISLGAFAAVQEFTRSRTWAAPFAAILMAGPFMYQLFVDGSQNALSSLALFPPLALLVGRGIRQPRAADVGLIALLFAGGLALYSLGVPALATWSAVILVVVAVAAALQGRLGRDVLWRTAKIVAVVAALAIALAPATFSRAVDFYDGFRRADFDFGGYPYKLPVEVIPSWLLQSRELYGIQENPAAASSLSQFLLTVLVPAALAAVAMFGIMRYREAWVIAAMVPTAAVLAYVSYLIAGGPVGAAYAVDRNLLIAAVVGVILLSVGLAAMAACERIALRVAAVTTAVVTLVLAGHNSYDMARRALDGGQILPGSVRELLPDLRGRHGVLYLEGIGARFPDATLEMPAIYNLVNEATPNQLAVDVSNVDYRGPLYLGAFDVPPPAPGPWFDPSYQWVLTMIPGIRTSRVPVARVGNIALERRTRRLDVTVGSGIAIDPLGRDPEGNAWIQDKLTLLVTGSSEDPVWIRLELRGSAVRPVAPSGVRVLARRPGTTVVCIPVRGPGPVRESVAASFGFEPAPSAATPSGFADPSPNHSLRLAGMWAVHRCSARPSGTSRLTN